MVFGAPAILVGIRAGIAVEAANGYLTNRTEKRVSDHIFSERRFIWIP